MTGLKNSDISCLKVPTLEHKTVYTKVLNKSIGKYISEQSIQRNELKSFTRMQ